MPIFAWIAVAWWGFCGLAWAARWWAWLHPDFDSWLRQRLDRLD